MKRVLAILLSLLLTAAALSGCGSDESASDINPFSLPTTVNTESNTGSPTESVFENNSTFKLTIRSSDSRCVLSEGLDSEPTDTLTAVKAEQVTNITYDWLPANLDTVQDGLHNGRNTLAYTFYVTNTDDHTHSCYTNLSIIRAIHDIDEAIRVMVYLNGDPEVFAKVNKTTDINGDPLPFETIYEKAPGDPNEKEDPDIQNTTRIATTDVLQPVTAFTDNTVFMGGIVDMDLEPGQSVRFTIVIWVEGEDPECLDKIRDGSIELDWKFALY